MKTPLAFLLILCCFHLQADCRKDTIYFSTTEDNVTYPKSRIINKFDASSKISESIKQDWNSTTEAYENWQKSSYIYHPNGKLKESIEQNWSLSLWVNSWRDTRTLDAGGNSIESYLQKWNQTSNNWESYSKQTNTFDLNNNRTTSIGTAWDNTASIWKNKYKTTYKYNADNNEIELIGEQWETGSSAWKIYTKFISTYNSDKQIETKTDIEYSSVTNQLENYYKTIYTYNTNKKTAIELIQQWDGTWTDDIKKVFTYNGNSEILEILEQDWNPVDMIWFNYQKETYNYDANQLLISKSKFSSWSQANNTFSFELRETYKCANYAAIKRSVQSNGLLIFPNPVNQDYIQITLPYNASFTMLDATGKVHMRGSLASGQNTIETYPVMANGFYLLCINGVSYPLVVQR